MSEEQSIDFSKPLKDRSQEELARALAALLRAEYPDSNPDDLMYAARKLTTDESLEENYYA